MWTNVTCRMHGEVYFEAVQKSIAPGGVWITRHPAASELVERCLALRADDPVVADTAFIKNNVVSTTQGRQFAIHWRWTDETSFPDYHAECGTFFDEFAGEVAEYDDKNRSVKYTHSETQPDDSLHAANYAPQIATRRLSAIAHF